MLTIGQLAAYAGVTTRAVRHYHQVGLLPEPERNHSGYRTYTAPDVVRLIRIRTLADAGVPLARVEELLAADDEGFSTAVTEIDRRLRAEIRELQEHRRRIAQLAAGDSLALPPTVTTYLDRMRALGAPEVMVQMERDAWILIAAQVPGRIDEFMVEKEAQLDDPTMRRFLRVMGEAVSGDAPEGRLVEMADLVVEMAEQAAARGELDGQDDAVPDQSFADLLDTVVLTAGPEMVRLRDRLLGLMEERGWSGLVRMERVEPGGG
ncbi:MerR family transcriptional regulator [Nocardioides sp.]|uniref:MerR family transcriptional regulator n=1 Tax=Nocardioides sp. TaxID=35761 RepID=UPI001A1CA500|nr:MerR family transcriptional regulator [Nocardioides sp.]MBJ7358452.1 MerR family transcriptional regulator [Nocardioides sp.]